MGSSEPEILKQRAPLDELLAAISDAITALMAWDAMAFQDAVDRQAAICAAFSSDASLLIHGSADSARKVLEMNRIYSRLLRHSIQWTRTLNVILQTRGDRRSKRAHFQG
jgi:hypothetical protein